jgi:hypothetical protein
MRSLPPRLVGVVFLLGSLGTTWCHRAVYETGRHGPAQVAEFGLGLASFLFACTGILLIIHGAALFGGVRARAGAGRLVTQSGTRIDRSAAAPDFRTLLDTRHGVSLVQAEYAIATAQPVKSNAVRTAR